MPKQFGSTVMFTVFLVAIAIAANRAEEDTDRSDRQRRGARGPASVNADLAGDVAPAPFRHTAKLHGPLEARVELIGEAPARAGDVFTLRGEVKGAQAITEVEYRWSIPPGLELVNGQTKDAFDEVDPKRPRSFELTLRAKTADNQQVHLLATAKARGARFAESAQFNTVTQAAFAASRARLGKSTLAAERARSALKVMH